MNLVNIIKPALNSFLFVLLLSGGSLMLSSTLFSSAANDNDKLEGVVFSTTPSPTSSVKVNPTGTKSSTSPRPVTKATPKPVPTCIVTINGSRYNVQSLRKTHSGGDIFKCGTDMTKVFQSMHGTNYDLIRKYKI